VKPKVETYAMRRRRALNKTAGFVLTVLPDSVQLRREVLENLLLIIGDEHPLQSEVASRLSYLDCSERKLTWLADEFRALATKVAP
jgi:hypothetical protein